MNALFISILIGIFVFIAIGAIEGAVLGDRGKQGNISSYLSYLRNEKDITKKMGTLERTETEENRNKKVYILYSIAISVIIFLIAVVAFKSLFLALVLSFLGLIFPKIMIDNANRKRKEKLNLQFMDALNSIIGSLKAGLSINSSMVKCFDDLNKIYSTRREKYIVNEFNKIKNDLSIGISIDDALRRFKQRVDLEDTDDFVNSVIIVRQKGGNMIEIMENVIKMISDKIEIRNEINVFTSAKKFEAKIITIVPIFLIVALSIFSPDYMEPLYGNLFGKILIVLGFVLLIVNYFVGKKITNINV